MIIKLAFIISSGQLGVNSKFKNSSPVCGGGEGGGQFTILHRCLYMYSLMVVYYDNPGACIFLQKLATKFSVKPT